MVGEGLVEAFFAVEGEDVEGDLEVADPEFMAAVVEEKVWLGTHGQSFLVCGGCTQEGFGVHPGPEG
jgi:hypothetical protein